MAASLQRQITLHADHSPNSKNYPKKAKRGKSYTSRPRKHSFHLFSIRNQPEPVISTTPHSPTCFMSPSWPMYYNCSSIHFITLTGTLPFLYPLYDTNRYVAIFVLSVIQVQCMSAQYMISWLLMSLSPNTAQFYSRCN